MICLNFNNYREKLLLEDKNKFDNFFKEFDKCCLIDFEEKEKLKDDFIKVIHYYTNNGISLEESLKLLDTKYLGDFYRDLSIQSFQLDNFAKLSSFSLSYDFMSVFRLSIYLKKDVIPELLQIALNFTIKRFPCFATKLKKGFFWHYLEVKKKRYYIEKESYIPCQSINLFNCDSQLFRVLYFKNRISIEFLHLLTDGTGGIMFLKALVAEYLRLIRNDIEIDDTILDINGNVFDEELENAFERVPFTNKASGFIDKGAVQLEGKLSKNKPYQIIHFKLEADKLKMIAKKNNTTVTGYLLSLMLIAHKETTKKRYGDSSIMVPINLRRFFPSKTIRNFSLYCRVRLPLKEISNFSSVVKSVNDQLKKKVSKQSMAEMVTSSKRILGFFKYIPLNIKRTGAKLVYLFISGIVSPNILSNLGVIELPMNISQNVESMDFVLNTTLINRLACTAITVNNVTTFSIIKMTNNSIFEEKMYDLFCRDSLIPIVEGSDFYED